MFVLFLAKVYINLKELQTGCEIGDSGPYIYLSRLNKLGIMYAYILKLCFSDYNNLGTGIISRYVKVTPKADQDYFKAPDVNRDRVPISFIKTTQ